MYMKTFIHREYEPNIKFRQNCSIGPFNLFYQALSNVHNHNLWLLFHTKTFPISLPPPWFPSSAVFSAPPEQYRRSPP